MNQIITRNFKRHLKRKRKQRKRHADRFFRSRLQKFIYYYTKFNSFFVLKNKILTLKHNIYNPTKKYKLAIKTFSMDYLNAKPLVALIKISKKYMRKNYIEKYLKYKMSVFPNFWFTAKPKAVRMGKGKGDRKRKIYFLKKGQIIYELRMKKFFKKQFNNKDLFLKLINFKIIFFLLKLKHKMPFKNKIISKKF